MQALLNLDPHPPKSRGNASHWTPLERKEIWETLLFWFEYPGQEEVDVEFLQNRAIRIHFDRLADLHWTETTFERFGYMLKRCGVRRVWFG